MASNAAINLSATGVVVAGVAGKRHRVLALHVQRDETVATTVTVQSWNGTTATAVSGDTTKSFVLPFNPEGWFVTEVGEGVRLALSAAIDVDGHIVTATVG